MRISIVTTVLNREKQIADAIESVACQTYSKIEHVIQDGGSTDDTLNIIRSKKSGNIVFESKPDNGIYEGLNRAIKRSTGEVIGLLHSDDRFATNNTIHDVMSVFAASDVDAVYGDLVYVSKHDQDRIVRYWRAGDYLPGKIKYGWMPPHPAMFIKRNVLEKFGCYDQEFKIAADYEAILRWLLVGKIKLHYLPQILVHMSIGGASNRSLLSIARKSYEDYRVIKRHHIGGLGTLALKNLRKAAQFLGQVPHSKIQK